MNLTGVIQQNAWQIKKRYYYSHLRIEIYLFSQTLDYSILKLFFVIYSNLHFEERKCFFYRRITTIRKFLCSVYSYFAYVFLWWILINFHFYLMYYYSNSFIHFRMIDKNYTRWNVRVWHISEWADFISLLASINKNIKKKRNFLLRKDNDHHQRNPFLFSIGLIFTKNI
jgi:hypothetical protein